MDQVAQALCLTLVVNCIAAFNRWRVDVDHEHAPNGEVRCRVGANPSLSSDLRILPLITYSVASGVVAVVLGAMISLTMQGSQRLMLWAAATGTASVIAGIVRESRLLSACRLAFGRFLRRLAKLSPTSF